MKINKYIFITSLLLILSKNGFSNYKHYNIKNGLSNTHINCINQDKLGYLWIGTDDGLNQFDGYEFKIFFHSPVDSNSLSSSAVYTIHISNDSNIWIGTFKGLDLYKAKNQSFEHKIIPFPNLKNNNLPVKTIAESSSGILWIGTSGGGLIAVNKKTWKPVHIINSYLFPVIKSDFIYSLLIDKNGKIWFGTENGGAYTYDPVNKILLPLSQIIKNKTIALIYEHTDNNIWLGTIYDGLYVYNQKYDKLQRFENYYNLPFNISGETIYSILKDDDNTISIGTNGSGIFKINLENKTIINEKYNPNNTQGISGNKIRVIFRDKQKNKWYAIHQTGIDMIPGFVYPFTTYNTDPQNEIVLSHNSILSICSDAEGNIWIGTDGGGINVINRAKKTVKVYNSARNPQWGINDVVRSIYMDYSGKMWFGFYLGGLGCYDPIKNTYKSFLYDPSNNNSLSNNDVTAIIQDKTGNIWIATNGGGLNMFDPLNKHFTHFKNNPSDPDNSISSDWLVTLYLDKQGMIWIGSYWGLTCLNPSDYHIQNYSSNSPIRRPLSNNSVNCIFEDSKGQIWVGTWGGLNLLDRTTGNCKVFTVHDGLPNNFINGIVEDDEGNLWLSTNNGICRFNYEKMSFSNFFEYEGLQSNEFIHGAYYKSTSGEIFFGGIKGLTCFYPKKIKANYINFNTLITDFKINYKSIIFSEDKHYTKILSKSIYETNTIHLPYNYNNINISFVNIDYIFPERIKYSYILEGFENSWQFSDYKKREVTYTNIEPGVYYFKIKSTDANGNWPVYSKILKIVIHPPFWLTLFAKILYIITFIIIAFFTVKYYIKRIKIKNNLKLEKIKKEKEDELNLSKLKFFTNISHEFRTPLTLIMGPLEELLSDSKMPEQYIRLLEIMKRNVKRMMRLINELLDLRKQETGNMQLKASYGDIISFIKEACSAFQQIAKQKNIFFDFTSFADSYYIWFDADKVDKIIFNLLSNAFRFTPSSGYIEVSISITDNNDNHPSIKQFITISVSDSGKGIQPEKLNKIFTRFYQIEENGILGGTGLGLSLAKEFAEMHSGKITVISEIDKGSCFTLFLPIGDAHLSENNKIVSTHKSNTQIIEEIKYEYTENELNETETPTNKQNNLPSILIVEDNHDLCSYINGILNKEFKVYEAYNGKEGWDKIQELLPDLVVTDIMMPEIDGIELCKLIKTNFQTSHIPVIMLTARAAEEQQITGIETGADSYITKPFNTRYLVATIHNIIETRHKLKEKFSNDEAFDIKELAITSSDEKFLQKLMEIIDQKITDPELSVEKLSKEIGMSRSHLHRKLKSLTGQVPNEFIRIVRLKMAARLLKTTDINIAELTYKIGFNNPSYFSTCFSKYFGISPTQYKEKYYTPKNIKNSFNDQILDEQ
jgi:signal transduction histidine kinase/ligand-binding sensor domain-containing protein/DNA-binding response OmpR family regulator